MKLFGFLKIPDINKEVETFRETEEGVLLDVRDPEEYIAGHIPGAINIPRDDIEKAENVIPDKSTPIFAYCYSGRRSDSAVISLKKMGYQNVRNIGGIMSFKGEFEK